MKALFDKQFLQKQILNKTFMKKQAFVAAGALIYVMAYNLLITPHNLYSGNLTGIAQLIRSFLIDIAGLSLPSNFNITGIILYLMNIPLFILAYKSIGRVFCIKSIIAMTLITLFFSFVPIPSMPLIDDPLTSCIIGGFVAGSGSGLILRQGSSGGGLDIIGMYFSKKDPNFSVGKAVLIVAVFVFTVCLFLYDFQVVVYSMIFTAVNSFSIDRAHHQNVKINAIIFTKNPEVGQIIIKDLSRGATTWKGEGVYSHEEMLVYMTVISLYEVSRLKRKVNEVDPNAFISFNKVSQVDGYFQQHL